MPKTPVGEPMVRTDSRWTRNSDRVRTEDGRGPCSVFAREDKQRRHQGGFRKGGKIHLARFESESAGRLDCVQRRLLSLPAARYIKGGGGCIGRNAMFLTEVVEKLTAGTECSSSL